MPINKNPLYIAASQYANLLKPLLDKSLGSLSKYRAHLFVPPKN